MSFIPGWLRRGYLALFTPLGDWLARSGVHPNSITVAGTLMWTLGGAMYGAGWIHAGGWFLGVTAFFDVLDGHVARATGTTSRFGAFLDSVLDRFADAAVLGGLLFFFATSETYGGAVPVLICATALAGSQMVSYVRARAEALGLECRSGLMQRPERVVLLSAPQAFFGLALGGGVLLGVISIIALSSWFTVAQRIVEVSRAARKLEVAAAPRMVDLSSAAPIRGAARDPE